MVVTRPSGLVVPTGQGLAGLVGQSAQQVAQDPSAQVETVRHFNTVAIRSLLIRSVGLVGRLENKSTDHKEGIAPVPLWVRPEPRWPGWDYRSPIIADNLQMTTHGSVQPSR